MKLYNIKDHAQQVTFAQAVTQGLGRNQGLFFPCELPKLKRIDGLLNEDFVTRSSKILSALVGDELAEDQLNAMLDNAFQFPAPVKKIQVNLFALELFHGPTLAFKDFGSRFMAQCIKAFCVEEKITILTATSGDTGAAVAHAFYGMDNIKVAILYPKGKISQLQETLFATLGGNIRSFAVDGDFDDCQALVKQAFDDKSLRENIGLNSANSINISRLLAQVCYYFEAVSQLQEAKHNLVVSVPSGNFGNLTAGLIAKSMGLPIKRFIAATNANDTVPRYLETGLWQPKPTLVTYSNAMDVSQPNNWPRIEELFRTQHWGLETLGRGAVSDRQALDAMRELFALGYVSEPHGAIGYRLLCEQLEPEETGLFLATAHPAKFKSSVEQTLSTTLSLPKTLACHLGLPLLSEPLANNYALLKKVLNAMNS